MKTLGEKNKKNIKVSRFFKRKKRGGGGLCVQLPPTMDEVPLVVRQGSLTQTFRQKLAELTRAECVKAGSAGPLGTSRNVWSLSPDRSQTP